MKKFLNIYILSAIVILGSCRKQLNVFPTTQEVDGNVIVDKQSAQTTLNGVYYLFANAGFDNNQNPSVLWISSNEILPSELSGLMTYPYGGDEFSSHIYKPSTYSVETIWKYGYAIVNAANGFLKNIEPVNNISADDKEKMIAEAKFLRAYANAELLFYYGRYDDESSPYGIILRKDFVTTKDIQLPRSSVKDCYDFILADLEDAIAALPDAGNEVYYANKWAAELLKARVLMVRGASGDYTEVINLCRDIISNSSYTLEENTKDIFLSKGLASNEVILGIKPYPNDVYKYTEYLYYNQAVGSDLLKGLFENDPRESWVYQTVPNYYMGGDMYVFTKYYAGMADDPSPTALSNVSYAMRLTEAYLLQAEAIAASGGDMDEARELLKTVMQHAGFTDFSEVYSAETPDALQQLIIKEEMKNFVGEAGQDWFAERRLPFATQQELQPSLINETLLILPIPQTEMKKNIKLTGMQNPGYGE